MFSIMINQTPEDINKVRSTLEYLNNYDNTKANVEQLQLEPLSDVIVWLQNMLDTLTDPSIGLELYDPTELLTEA